MDTDALRCLSIRQPWAWLITHRGKDVENRRWRNGYIGPVLIHAGLQTDEVAMRDPLLAPLLHGAILCTGGIVGACVVTGCVSDSGSPWFFGPYAFTLAKALPLPLVPMPGRLGFFRPTLGALAAVLPALAGWPP